MSGMRRMCTKGVPTKTAGAIPTSLLQRSGCNISKEFACLRCSCMLCRWLTGGRMCPSPHQHMIWLEALEVLTDLWLRFCTPFDILKVSKVKGSISVARCPVLWNWMPASLRKVRVGPKSLKYKALIEDWKQQAAWWQESSSTLLAVRSDLRML